MKLNNPIVGARVTTDSETEYCILGILIKKDIELILKHPIPSFPPIDSPSLYVFRQIYYPIAKKDMRI